MNRILILLLSLVLCHSANAQVEQVQLTTAVLNREPIDNLGNKVTAQPGETIKVSLFSHAKNLDGKTLVHRWFYKGEEKAAIELKIGSNSWRTYSSKTILPAWQGEWQVQIWLGDLQLTSHDFTFSLD